MWEKKGKETIPQPTPKRMIGSVIFHVYFLAFLVIAAAAAAKLLQSCPTPCDPIDGSPPGSPRPWDSPGKNTRVGCHFLLH